MTATVPPSPLTPEEEAVMRALGRLMLVLPRSLNQDLERGQRMALSEYSVLRHLSESKCGLMRMSELAQACDMSLSGMTRLAAKLESSGYVKRIKCEDDARGWNAVLTPQGLARPKRPGRRTCSACGGGSSITSATSTCSRWPRRSTP